MLNEMNFTNFADFIDQLNEVSDVTEWVRTNLDNIKLEKLDNNNPFPNFGGDAYGIGITIDDEPTIPLRSTSINTLITRADVSGKGIQRVFDERKDLFCEHLNAYYALVAMWQKQPCECTRILLSMMINLFRLQAQLQQGIMGKLIYLMLSIISKRLSSVLKRLADPLQVLKTSK